MVYAICYYHIIWSTKFRQPLITPEIERIIIRAIQQKSKQLKAQIHAVNMVADHVHVAVSIPPALAVSLWLRDIKGLSAHEINHFLPNLDTKFRWQNGYSVLTFGKKRLPYVVAYIDQQKEHHQEQTTVPYLEYLEDDS